MKGNFKKIVSFYESIDSKPDYVLITHAHMDHVGALFDVVKKYSPKVYAHGLDLKVVKGEENLPTRSFMIKLASSFF